MKIKVFENQLTRAINRLIGIDIIVDSIEEARRALYLILEKTDASKREDFKKIAEIKISQKVEHPTTAMEHRTAFIFEFILEDDSALPMEIALIQELQRIFRQAGP